MNIIDHGKWVPYRPTPHPAHLPPNVEFVRRESDGVDWYDFIYQEIVAQPTGMMKDGKTPTYPPGPAKYMTVRDFLKSEATVKCSAVFQPGFNAYIIGPAVYDVTKVFPVNQYAFVIEGYTGTDPQADFGGKEYKPLEGTINDAVMTIYQLERVRVVERIQAANKFQRLRAFLNANPLKAELWYGTQFIEPQNPLVLGILRNIGADPAVILAPPDVGSP